LPPITKKLLSVVISAILFENFWQLL